MTKFKIARLVEEDHRRLRAREAALHFQLGRHVPPEAYADWRRDLLRELRDFQYHLFRHFDLEEDGGFMADLIAHVPRMSSQIAALEEEHGELLSWLDGIVADLKAAATPGDWEKAGLTVRIKELLVALKRHRSAECDLIQEAYYQDIGIAD